MQRVTDLCRGPFVHVHVHAWTWIGSGDLARACIKKGPARRPWIRTEPSQTQGFVYKKRKIFFFYIDRGLGLEGSGLSDHNTKLLYRQARPTEAEGKPIHTWTCTWTWTPFYT